MERRVGGENFIAALRHHEGGADRTGKGRVSGRGTRPDEEDGKRGERPHLGPAVEVLAGGMLRWMPQN